MSTRPALQPSAAPDAAIRSGEGRRSPNSCDRLHRLLERFRRLVVDAEHEGSILSHHAAEAEAFAADLMSFFRPEAAAIHPPLWQQGGRAIW